MEEPWKVGTSIMKSQNPPIVIAIAGVSGGGKTTIAKSLNDKLHNSKILCFDDYDFHGPDDIIEWVDNAANYDQWNLEPLIIDLEVLLTEHLDYIVLDFPFAYKHAKISNLIDFAVFIDTPLDIAIARRIIRDFKNCPGESILHEMENYLSGGRRGYLEMLKSIKPNSDIIEDGSQSVSEITDNIYQAIQRH